MDIVKKINVKRFELIEVKKCLILEQNLQN